MNRRRAGGAAAAWPRRCPAGPGRPKPASKCRHTLAGRRTAAGLLPVQLEYPSHRTSEMALVGNQRVLPHSTSGRGVVSSPMGSSDHLYLQSAHSSSGRANSIDEFGQYPLHSHGKFGEDDLDEGSTSGLPASLQQISQNNAIQPVSKPIPGSDNFPFVQINAYIWFCTASVQDEADASYILLSEFMQIGLSCLKVTSTDFNEKTASKKISILFKKYLPTFLTVSPKIGFEGFNLAMIDLVSELLPHQCVKERVLWLGKVRFRMHTTLA